MNIYLKRELPDDLSVAHKWIIQPRYKLRNENDPVRVNDHVVFRNAQYKNLIITSFKVQNESYEHLVALDKFENCTNKVGIKIIRLTSDRLSSLEFAQDKGLSESNEVDYLKGNDFIRLAHREYGGHVLARLNDEKEILSVVTPFGSVSRKNTAFKDHSTLIVVRPYHMQQPPTQYDFATAFSCLGIWQVILVKPYNDTTLQGKVRKGSRVRIRNLITGQYLAIRPAVHADIELVLHKAKKKTTLAAHSKDERDEPPPGSSRRKSPLPVDDEDSVLDLESIKFLDEEAPAKDLKPNSYFKITLLQATVPDLKKMEWIGKNNPYLTFTFVNRFKSQTDPIEGAQNTAEWDLSSNYQGMFFEVDDMHLVMDDLQIDFMNKHSLFRDSLVGSGTVNLSSVRSVTHSAVVELNVPLFNKKKRKVGVVKLSVNVEKVMASSKVLDEPQASDELFIVSPDAPVKRNDEAGPTFSRKVQPSSVPPALGSPTEKNLEWIVATSSQPTEYTVFNIHALNKEFSNRDNFIRYDDNVYFESTVLKHRFQLVSPSQGRHLSKWWEYKEDARLEPKQMNPDYIIDSEVFLLERVAAVEVQDTLYACKVLPLARAATVTLQLTPSVSLLYSPLFRHFRKYLNTLTIWCLGGVHHDGSLLPEEGNYPHKKNTTSSFGERMVDVSFDQEEEESHDLMNDLGLNFLIPRVESLDSHGNGKVQQNHSNNISLQHVDISPTKSKLDGVSNKVDKSKFSSSSLFPWLGRKVGTEFVSVSNEASPLEHYTEFIVDDVLNTSAATNPVIMRRQSILFDLKLMEQLMHFLNVFFILQRAISYTENSDVLVEYPGLPNVVQQCSHAVHLLLSAAVHSNERNALKLLSIRGSLLSLISQKILGWNPPLESIVKVAFETSKNAQNDQEQQSEEEDSQVNAKDRFKLEDVLVHSITSSDIRQILEQMNEMNHNGDLGAQNLLSLLTLLCQAGNAKKYFQNIIIRYLITCDTRIADFSPTSNFGRGKQYPRQHESLLFETDYHNHEWMVRFQTNFILPPQEDRNEESFKKELLEEGESMRLLFYNYNRAEVDNDVLDLEECFLLLEDLGFGGPFLYEEIGRVMGTNIWGFLHWWCYRSAFYYPSSSIAHSQISPIQAMKLIDPKIDDVLIMVELNRRCIDRDSIMRSLRFQSIISSRIPGLNLIFAEKNDEVYTGSFYWKGLKKSQSILGVKSNPIKKMRTSKLKEKLGPQHRAWIPFTEALTKSPMRDWFRGSMKLLTAVCEGSNSLAQRVVSVLLPAECILNCIFSEHLTYNDKYMFCDLLTNIYIDNIFVFPTRCIPVRREGLYCAYGEDIFNPSVSLGKIFNPLSRVCLDDECFIEGSQLRNQLFEFIKKEATEFIFYSTSNDIMNYNRALLKLFRKLLYQGFFGELDFYFLDFSSEMLQSRTYFFSSSETEEYLQRPTNLKEFELLVMKKLIEVKEIHRNQDLNADPNESVNNLIEGNEGLNAARKAREEKRTSKKAKNRKKFVTIFDDLATFDRIFSDVGYTSLVHSAISALGEFMEIRQMYRVQKLWDHIRQFAGKFSLVAYGNDLSDFEKVLDDKALYYVFDDLVNEHYDDETFVKAIFSGILHSDRNLIQECLQLLDRRLSLYRGIYDLMDCCNFVEHPSHAIINRCISNYMIHLYDLIVEVMESETQRRIHTMQIIDFFIENILSLLLKSDLEKFSNSLTSAKSSQENDEDGTVAVKGKENEAKTRFIKDRNKIIIYYLISGEIHCPVGEDDFFLLDLKSLSSNPDELQALLNQFSDDLINTTKENLKWLVDAKATIAVFTDKIVRLFPSLLLLSFTKGLDEEEAANFRVQDITWEELSSSKKIIVDKIFSFLSILWKEQTEIPLRWFPSLTDLLLAVYPECNGAVSFLHTIIQHSTEEILYLDFKTIDNLIKDLSMYPEALSLPIKFRLMLSLIGSKNRGLVEKGGIMIIDHLSEYFMSKFRVLETSYHESNNDASQQASYNSLAVQILQPIYTFITSPVYEDEEIPESFVSGFQLFCTPHFCEMLFTSKHLHLKAKQYLLIISLKLFSIDDFPLEDLLVKQLRSLRLFFHLLKEDSKSRNLTGVKQFYFEAVFPYLKHRVLETNILSERVIYSFLFSEFENQKSKLYNTVLADEIMNKLVKLFEPVSTNSKVGEMKLLSVEEKGTSYLPCEIITCLMIVLNTLAYHDCTLFRQCTTEEKQSLIWVSGAVLLFLQSRPDFIFDRELNQVIDFKLYEKVKDRLKELFEGFLLDFISIHTELHLHDYYNKLLLSHFRAIIKDQFENTNNVKPTINLSSVRKQRNQAFSRIPRKVKSLKQGLNISVAYNEKFLKKTALFDFLKTSVHDAMDFINLGGMALFATDSMQQLVSSKSFAKKFSNYSIFDLWLKGNGKYLSNVVFYLGNITNPRQYDYNFIHIISSLLSHDIEEIQENPIYSTNYRSSLIHAEQERLYEIQNALAALGCLEMTVKVFGRCYTSNNLDYQWKYTPLMLKVASELIAWQNKTMQAATIDLIEKAIMLQKPPERYCLVGLQKLIRKAATEIVGGAALNVGADQADQHITKILRVLAHFCSFAGALCSGDNTRSQRFFVGLTKSTDNSRLFVDLTQDVCIFVNAVLIRLVDMITYIKNENFVNRLAPFVYESKDNSKRRFLAWHDSKNNLSIMIQFVFALSIAFDNCISLCCTESVHAILKALPKTPELLEFLGVLQLNATSQVGSSAIPGMKRQVVWKGGHPIDFYRTLIREMKGMEAFHTDPDFVDFAISFKKWSDIIAQAGLIGSTSINSYFHKIFGVNYDLFMECTKRNENSCLRLILSALEVAPRADMADFAGKFTDSILVQNLDSSFKKLVWTFLSNKDRLTSTTVAYVSLIESIGRVNKFTDDLLTEWDSSFQGIVVTKPKSIYGSVELVDETGRVRRLYFPIPSFVSQFWTYPEVQKTKEAVVYEVNRSSPEEKIGDFLTQMSRLTVVMKRQERLSLLLTYPIHAIFGGKSIPGGTYLPKQNNLALCLTLGLNAYFVYYNTNPFTLPALSGDYLDIYHWDTRTMVVQIVQWVHFLLLGAYACRSVLNSDAADEINLFEGDGIIMKLLNFIINLPYAIYLIVQSALWPLLLALMAFWAMYSESYWLYVPCLLDVTIQYEVMNFLFQAIKRNVFRIGATLLLAFLCLYFYSIIAFLYIGDQYNLGGYEGCSDPGACFKLHLDYGLQNSPQWTMKGYISPDLGLKFPYAHQASYIIGTGYNLTYVIMINLVLQALISGLIIDTFSEMRQEREDTQADIDSQCFICSIKRDEFEQRGISYKTHITEEHNMWHYLWFKLYLDLKDPLGFSSTENYAFRNFREKQVSKIIN